MKKTVKRVRRPIISLKFNLTLKRRNFELNLSGEFNRGIYGIFGHSGAGKTSLFSLLNGLEVPDTGKIVLNDRVLVDTKSGVFTKANKRKIGVVFQEKLLFPHLTIKENLLFGYKYLNRIKISLYEVVSMLNLKHLLNAYPNQISGGEQQRVAIGRALLTSPEMLLLDEPFNAVDNNLRLSILPYIKKISERLNIPILVISHDLPDIQRLTENIYVIENGKNIGFGSIVDIIKRGTRFNELEFQNRFQLSNSELVNDLWESDVNGISSLKIKSLVAPKKDFTLILSPDDVSISKNYISDISIQNQIKGTIKDILEIDNGYLVVVNCGVDIISRISESSMKLLNLKKDIVVWTLFKAYSLYT